MVDLKIENKKGFLFDLDGVLTMEGDPLPGAIEVISLLDKKQIPFRIVTNLTTKSTLNQFEHLSDIGFPVERSQIFNPMRAAVHFLEKKVSPEVYFMMREDTRREFSKFDESDHDPDYVIIGDMADTWNFYIMNKAFRLIMNGAEIIALHKGRYYKVKGGLRMDIGAFVAGLEYVTGKKAIVMGKPSHDFFQMALEHMNVRPEEAVLVGDDIQSDVGGAQNAGIMGILATSGKYREGDEKRFGVTPDARIKSIADVIPYIENM